MTERISSLDAPLSDGDDRALIEQLAMDSAMPLAADEAAGVRIRIWMGQLPPRQRLVLERRYGLNDEGTQTLAEIAAELGLTRERVRQIQSEALARTACPGRCREQVSLKAKLLARQKEHRYRTPPFADQHVECACHRSVVHRFQADTALEKFPSIACDGKVVRVPVPSSTTSGCRSSTRAMASVSRSPTLRAAKSSTTRSAATTGCGETCGRRR